ncbi:FeoA family protein [Proteus faecis]|uniref:FeoA family protein n=1 Tax=Proteus faecis TaxID=2050967 RepID=A0AAW7CPY3_9GAMM|nr:FeoA family protein [Proteus faecis]MDO5404200.1 FeoA family protein [Proteus sp. (in: enterobacteria)]MDL5168240.1 FeoA family protein [Proteus faecis]MDL5276225.1 FeoA family protein [Proteus faecis]MDL5279701.1 FeoA family protein [Proteus faecis]MDL5308703.1 FeoA family protein [Proteus faecis]
MSNIKLMSLDKVKPNRIATIKAVKSADLLLKQKLFNMGFIPGVSIEMIRSAPLLDPIEIKVLDYLVVLRREEASMIEVEIND